MREVGSVFVSKKAVTDSTFVGKNYGYVWVPNELDKLYRYFEAGITLFELCRALERPALGVVARLIKAGLIKETPAGVYEVASLTPRPDPLPSSPDFSDIKDAREMQAANSDAKCANTTSAANIETLTLIGGINAATVSDDSIFHRIAQLESEIETLSAIKTKPKKLEAKIKGLQADIQALVKYVDERESLQ